MKRKKQHVVVLPYGQASRGRHSAEESPQDARVRASLTKKLKRMGVTVVDPRNG